MFNSLLRRYSIITIINNELTEKINGSLGCLRNHLLVADSTTVREGNLAVVRKTRHSRPHLLGGRAQVAYDQTQLVDVILPGEERAVVEELG